MDGNNRIPTENISKVILSLLRLEGGSVLTYQTYYDRIKKKLMISRAGGARLPDEEDQLLRDELKRVWRIKDKSKLFKIKADAQTTSSEPSVPPPPSSPSQRNGRRGNRSNIVRTPNKKPEQKDTLYDILNRINVRLGSILENLNATNRVNVRSRERARISEEESRRSSREKELESRTSKPLFEAVKKILAPFQSIWDRILNFFWNVFLGKIVVNILKWFADKKNIEKVESLIRFVKDWWPALVGGYILFGTSFGKLIRTLIPSVTRFIFQIGKFAIPKLLSFAKSPLGAGALLLTAGATIPALFPGTVNEQERKTENAPGSNAEKIKKLEDQKANLNAFEKLQGKGSEIDEQIQILKTGKPKSYGFAGGGYAGRIKKLLNRDQKVTRSSGFVSGPGGPTGDKIPAMLSDGEFVMSAAAVNKYGVERLEAMNAAGGGTNRPKFSNGVVRAWGGGFISDEDLRKQAAAQAPSTGGVKGARVYKFDPNNPQHVSQYELLKKRAISKGLFQETPPKQTQKPSGSTQSPPSSSSTSSQGPSRTPPPEPPASSRGPSRTPPPEPPASSRGSTRTPSSRPKLSSKIFGNLMRLGFAIPLVMDVVNLIKEKRYKDATRLVINAGLSAAVFESVLGLSGAAAVAQALFSGGTLTPTAAATLIGGVGAATVAGKATSDISERLLSGFGLTDEIEKRSTGASVGGWGLKIQSFRDAPKTQIMTDDQGRPFIGHKAMRNGKLVYIRSSSRPTNTSNPIEMLGRIINPDAYTQSDSIANMKAHKIALVNSLQSLQERGASVDAQRRMMMSMGSNLTDVQNDLNYRRSGRGQQILRNRANQRRLESQRPWWDKMGWFGGRSAQIRGQQRSQFEAINPGARLYNTPRPNTGTPHRSRFARPRNASYRPAPPPTGRRTRITVVGRGTNRGSRGNRPNNQNVPRFNSSHGRSRGSTVSAATYGVRR